MSEIWARVGLGRKREVDWLTQYNLGSLKMATSYWRVKNLGISQSVRPDVSSVPIWYLRPEGFLESCWSLVCVGILEKWVLISVKKCSSSPG